MNSPITPITPIAAPEKPQVTTPQKSKAFYCLADLDATIAIYPAFNFDPDRRWKTQEYLILSFLAQGTGPRIKGRPGKRRNPERNKLRKFLLPLIVEWTKEQTGFFEMIVRYGRKDNLEEGIGFREDCLGSKCINDLLQKLFTKGRTYRFDLAIPVYPGLVSPDPKWGVQNEICNLIEFLGLVPSQQTRAIKTWKPA